MLRNSKKHKSQLSLFKKTKGKHSGYVKKVKTVKNNKHLVRSTKYKKQTGGAGAVDNLAVSYSVNTLKNLNRLSQQNAAHPEISRPSNLRLINPRPSYPRSINLYLQTQESMKETTASHEDLSRYFYNQIQTYTTKTDIRKHAEHFAKCKKVITFLNTTSEYSSQKYSLDAILDISNPYRPIDEPTQFNDKITGKLMKLFKKVNNLKEIKELEKFRKLKIESFINGIIKKIKLQKSQRQQPANTITSLSEENYLEEATDDTISKYNYINLYKLSLGGYKELQKFTETYALFKYHLHLQKKVIEKLFTIMKDNNECFPEMKKCYFNVNNVKCMIEAIYETEKTNKTENTLGRIATDMFKSNGDINYFFTSAPAYNTSNPAYNLTPIIDECANQILPILDDHVYSLQYFKTFKVVLNEENQDYQSLADSQKLYRDTEAEVELVRKTIDEIRKNTERKGNNTNRNFTKTLAPENPNESFSFV
jgi:hypothetical protein